MHATPPPHPHPHRLNKSGLQHTGNSRNQPQGPQHPEGPQSFDVQASGLSRRVVGLPRFVVRHALGDDAEEPAQTRRPRQ